MHVCRMYVGVSYICMCVYVQHVCVCVCVCVRCLHHTHSQYVITVLDLIMETSNVPALSNVYTRKVKGETLLLRSGCKTLFVYLRIQS